MQAQAARSSASMGEMPQDPVRKMLAMLWPHMSYRQNHVSPTRLLCSCRFWRGPYRLARLSANLRYQRLVTKVIYAYFDSSIHVYIYIYGCGSKLTRRGKPQVLVSMSPLPDRASHLILAFRLFGATAIYIYIYLYQLDPIREVRPEPPNPRTEPSPSLLN